MSDWGAVEKSGEAIHASKFHKDFLNTGKKYSEFYCPFCGVKLTQNNIYKDEKDMKKKPYFSARNGHEQNCDGNPKLINKIKKPQKTHFEFNGADIPGALVNRQVPRITVTTSAFDNDPPLAETSRLNDKKTLKSKGKVTHQTNSIQRIVEVYNNVISEIYQQASEKNWNNDLRSSTINSRLTNMPLRLLEHNTNYSDAFRTPQFIEYKAPRIYKVQGKVEKIDTEYIITSKTDAKKNGRNIPFIIEIKTTLHRQLKPHEQVLNKIDGYTKSNTSMKWFAFGTPKTEGDRYILTIQNLDYIFVK